MRVYTRMMETWRLTLDYRAQTWGSRAVAVANSKFPAPLLAVVAHALRKERIRSQLLTMELQPKDDRFLDQHLSAKSKRLFDFIVEGEHRYWVYVAIDRLTGQVLNKQIEVVNE